MIMNEFLEALHKGLGFTWIQKNYMKLTKFELVNIAKELIYAIEDSSILDSDKKEIFDVVDENLREEEY